MMFMTSNILLDFPELLIATIRYISIYSELR